METYAKRSEPTARPISARAGHGQPDMATVLQAYRNRTAQFAALTDKDDELVQGKLTAQLQEEEEETLQGKIVAQLQNDEEEETLQGKFVTQLQGFDEEEPLQQKAENRTGLPDRIKNGVESLSGYSLDAVKVYKNSPKPAQLQAYAYTQGTDIHVAPGQERYLGHEAWHVVQQMQGRVKPTTQLQGIAVNDNEGLEREADVMGEKALASNSKYAQQNRLNMFSPVNSVNYPVQGGWKGVLGATALALGGAAAAVLAPATIPYLAAAAGLADIVHGGISAVNAMKTERYVIPAGSDLTITNAKGTIDGKNLINAGPDITSPGKINANIEIDNGGIGTSGTFVHETTGGKVARVAEAGFPIIGGLTAGFSPFMKSLGASEKVTGAVTGGSSGSYIGGHITSL